MKFKVGDMVNIVNVDYSKWDILGPNDLPDDYRQGKVSKVVGLNARGWNYLVDLFSYTDNTLIKRHIGFKTEELVLTKISDFKKQLDEI
jgi:ribosomal protein L21E